ncbi:sigma-70 family RNA polymerase sigma factor [Actinomadura sp. KC06]|uniref:RNA polymerase sigma factor n=1 Tax=Actinomadura sp. KC06 TaxID=2530369 RepID=UPI00104FB3A6|nr:sigma-70 family RNA polymerase sigma factor [Actinomadura sp. KC06]TDD34289.1 sigma-70 family RNA polymerase sigma factor [Actinomadura sp. KC06]
MASFPSAEDGFRDLFLEQQQRLLGYLIGMCGDLHLAEDVLNQAFMVLWRQWGRPEVRNGSPVQYLFTVARHLMLDELDAHRGTARPILEDAEEIADAAAPSVEEAVILRKHLHWALSQLSPRERETVILRHYLEYDNATAAQIMSSGQAPMAVGTVKRYGSDGCRKLRGLLDRDHLAEEGGGQR